MTQFVIDDVTTIFVVVLYLLFLFAVIVAVALFVGRLWLFPIVSPITITHNAGVIVVSIIFLRRFSLW